ncbi:hypothetical protein [Humisphaera borealis]|uniref:Uncharacterized protein n=1 Tax=Humisphaera borealis TaxID=2807512 RepID=A0A7M2X0A4_9BACT|nr:hypothetical protein [Humisphaera borealis]QOV91125.1 hypothetical protein IPV69_07140 [Humisphaera borealis]
MPRPGRVLVRAIIFLIVFSLVLLAAMKLYLLPAMAAMKDADQRQREHLQATAVLMLCVVLFVLFAGLLLTFRPGRFFFPRAPLARAKPTVYVDAWAEAGRRAKVEPEDGKDRDVDL